MTTMTQQRSHRRSTGKVTGEEEPQSVGFGFKERRGAVTAATHNSERTSRKTHMFFGLVDSEQRGHSGCPAVHSEFIRCRTVSRATDGPVREDRGEY